MTPFQKAVISTGHILRGQKQHSSVEPEALRWSCCRFLAMRCKVSLDQPEGLPQLSAKFGQKSSWGRNEIQCCQNLTVSKTHADRVNRPLTKYKHFGNILLFLCELCLLVLQLHSLSSLLSHAIQDVTDTMIRKTELKEVFTSDCADQQREARVLFQAERFGRLHLLDWLAVAFDWVAQPGTITQTINFLKPQFCAQPQQVRKTLQICPCSWAVVAAKRFSICEKPAKSKETLSISPTIACSMLRCISRYWTILAFTSSTWAWKERSCSLNSA